MSVVAIVLVVVIAGILIWRFALGGEQAPRHSVRDHERVMGRLGEVARRSDRRGYRHRGFGHGAATGAGSVSGAGGDPAAAASAQGNEGGDALDEGDDDHDDGQEDSGARAGSATHRGASFAGEARMGRSGLPLASPPAERRGYVRGRPRSGFDEVLDGLPPPAVVATGLAAVVVVVGVVIGILLAVRPSSRGTANPPVSAPSTAPMTSTTHAGVAVTTLPVTLQTVALSGGDPVYSAPPGTYRVTVVTTQPTWVQIEEVPASGSSTTVYAGTMSSGQSETQKVSGPVDIDVGKMGVTISVNGVPLAIPQGHQAGWFDLR